MGLPNLFPMLKYPKAMGINPKYLTLGIGKDSQTMPTIIDSPPIIYTKILGTELNEHIKYAIGPTQTTKPTRIHTNKAKLAIINHSPHLRLALKKKNSLLCQCLPPHILLQHHKDSKY